MSIQAVKSYGFNLPNISAKPETKSTSVNIQENKEETKKLQDIKTYSAKQVGGVVVAAALSAAVLGGAIMHGKARAKIKNLKDANEALMYSLVQTKTALSEELEKANNKLSDCISINIENKPVDEKLYTNLKNIINNKRKIEYDILNPPLPEKENNIIGELINLPESVFTNNREYIKKLNIPKIDENGYFDFQLPMTQDVKITKMQTREFKPISNQVTNITESYADSVQWNNDKIVRDILQNFFDGHGQTLDGVHFMFTPKENGKYLVKIQGESTYTPDKAIYIGESTKRNDSKAAGNYGEGLKMSVLKLLKDGGSDNVKIASDNWKLTYSLANTDLSDKRVLVYSLEQVDKMDGNYLEFETSDRNLLYTFRKSINRFYNSGNEHFRCPDFENNVFGIKNLPEGELGGIYIAGQRFEYKNKYDSLGNIVFILKQKPPISVLDPSRDRTSLSVLDLKNLATWLSKSTKMSKTDKVNLLRALEPYWESVSDIEKHPINAFVSSFLDVINDGQEKFSIVFPDKYLADVYTSPDVIMTLMQKGYVICDKNFANVGMKTVREFLKESEIHKALTPNNVEQKKIILLKEALNVLSSALSKEDFKSHEIDAKIYLFDRGTDASKYNEDTLAEAITDFSESKGFWIDKNYLNEAPFSHILETALHELSHKEGGDGSMSFSYKLTNVNKAVLEQMVENTETIEVLKVLNKLWSEVGQEAQVV